MLAAGNDHVHGSALAAFVDASALGAGRTIGAGLDRPAFGPQRRLLDHLADQLHVLLFVGMADAATRGHGTAAALGDVRNSFVLYVMSAEGIVGMSHV